MSSFHIQELHSVSMTVRSPILYQPHLCFFLQPLLYLITTTALSQSHTAPYLGQIKRLLLVSICLLASEDVHLLILRTGYIVKANFAEVIKVKDLEIGRVPWITHKFLKSRKLSSCDPRIVWLNKKCQKDVTLLALMVKGGGHETRNASFSESWKRPGQHSPLLPPERNEVLPTLWFRLRETRVRILTHGNLR